MAFSGPNMFCLPLVTITIELSCSNRSRLKI